MNGYLYCTDTFIVFIQQNVIHAIDKKSKSKLQKVHSNDLVFLRGGFLLDAKKQLFQIEISDEIKLHHICSTKKSISDVVIYKGDVYYCDRFGDVYTIKDNHALLLFGNMCFTTSLLVGEQIWTSDKYGRIRISNHNGSIMKYIFCKESIYCMIETKLYVCAGLKNKKVCIVNKMTHEIKFVDLPDNINKLLEFQNCLLCLCKKSEVLVNLENLTSKVLSNHGFIDGCITQNILCGLTDDGKIVYNDEMLLDGKYKYKDNYDLFTIKIDPYKAFC